MTAPSGRKARAHGPEAAGPRTRAVGGLCDRDDARRAPRVGARAGIAGRASRWPDPLTACAPCVRRGADGAAAVRRGLRPVPSPDTGSRAPSRTPPGRGPVPWDRGHGRRTHRLRPEFDKVGGCGKRGGRSALDGKRRRGAPPSGTRGEAAGRNRGVERVAPRRERRYRAWRRRGRSARSAAAAIGTRTGHAGRAVGPRRPTGAAPGGMPRRHRGHGRRPAREGRGA